MKKQIPGVVLVALLPVTAWSGGGHYPVDDADIVAPGDFQIETWYSHLNNRQSEFGFLPAMTLFDRVEITAGYYRLQVGSEYFDRFEPAAKWQFAPIEDGAIASALAVTVGYEDGEWSDWLVNAPVSYAMAQAPFVFHLNAGWIHEREDSSDHLFTGAAVEWSASDRFDLIAQVYREGADEDAEAQIGVRAGVGGGVEHLDIAVGRNLGRDGDWFMTAGLALAF
jgi:hypothetical protein